MPVFLLIYLGLIVLGFIFQIVGSFKLDEDLMLDGFLLQTLAVFLVILGAV